MAVNPGGTNGGDKALLRDISQLAATVARIDSQVASLSTQMSGLSARFDEQVGTVAGVTGRIGLADWKTVTAVAALFLGMWQFAIRPLEKSADQLNAGQAATAEQLAEYRIQHESYVAATNARQDEAISALKSASAGSRLATLEASVRNLAEQNARRFDEVIRNAESRGAQRILESGDQ